MAGSAQYAVTTSAQIVASAPAGAGALPVGKAYFSNGTGAAVFLGGANVTTTNGYQMAVSTAFAADLYPGDVIWAVVASTGSTLSVLQTGA
jgi:hypothetical protein